MKGDSLCSFLCEGLKSVTYGHRPPKLLSLPTSNLTLNILILMLGIGNIILFSYTFTFYCEKLHMPSE